MLPLSLRKCLLRIGIRLPIVSQAINFHYNELSWKEKERWHREYSCLDSDHFQPFWDWEIEFAGHSFRMPLKYWEQMLTVLGYDVEQKKLYAKLFFQFKVGGFVDVGANYGTHSFLALACGLPVTMFEPNPECLSCIEEVCRINDWHPTVENVAVGSKQTVLNLFYPKGKTWLGIVGEDYDIATANKVVSDPNPPPHLTAEWLDKNNIEAVGVCMTTLDAYFEQFENAPIIKIDVEGHELAVLQGGSKVMAEAYPYLVFESFPGSTHRAAIFDLLTERGYQCFHGVGSSWCLDRNEFIASNFTNFTAS